MSINIVSRVKARSDKLFYGWRIVAVSFFINAFGVGTFFYGFSTFFNPMIVEFGWSRTLMSGVYSLSRLEGGLEGPIVGWLIDKFGARKILFTGILIAGVGFILLSQVRSPLSLYLIFGLTLSLGYNLGYIHGTGAAVAKWFVKKRGRAFSFLYTGNGIGGAIFVPLIAWLIVQYGWRSAAVIIGVATLAIPLPLSLIIRSTPEEMGLVPDGEPGSKADSLDEAVQKAKGVSVGSTIPEEVNFTVGDAIRTRAFWVYSASMMLRSCILSAIVVHQIPHLTDIGIPYQAASKVLGLMVLMSVPGRFVFGWLGDRFEKRMILFLLCMLQGVGIFIFINANTIVLLYLFVVVFGLGYGGVIPLTIALRADLFGRKNYATIAGITMTMAMVGTVAAPVFAGYLYDVSQSYNLAFYIFIGMIVLSGVLFLLIPRTSQQASSSEVC
ncbi:MAG: MFS transporter [Deltaproteobacteria bacterium]|nr:MFS transporter [Deltaproteobacteria bacterium]